MIEKAISIAVQAHSGQIDKAGRPYILHPIRVMVAGKNDAQMITGILHDVIEDTPVSLGMLRKEGFSDEVLEALDCLTHRQTDTYEEYIDRIAKNPLAVAVKLHDLTDNMNRNRIVTYTEADEKRHAKYMRSYEKLQKIAKEQDICY